MIEVLRQGSRVDGFALNMAASIANAPQDASLTLDFNSLDEAMHRLQGAVDEITVLGPALILPVLNAYAKEVRGVTDCSTAYGSQVDIDAKCVDLNEAKTKLVSAAALAGLVG